mmetsp:Transcript_88278/g.234736  ORF Transcript_88278/g.234736 Transcript_88278/m.234736 type:complete len:139 (-) Transcript_88278:621-1037(-)|eukprot:CAMPEP_0113682220 /NCGR_PEP_ID=MMETSP0038_2-20120614/12513_1 /TAXON_ID=2898 /ORGANISM="Cryptomonas paramecium" /LENGTH=138 /DNA_ID=CAMNT_0000601207 /DNA_START=94 /DNA_END=510 /DNA_ORIENTATION=- /assembly_acc=CAM_ASM_000170
MQGQNQECNAAGAQQQIQAGGKQGRSVLTREQAVEIYRLGEGAKRDSAYKVAKLYGVCEKAIRDIWSGRTWRNATRVQKDDQICSETPKKKARKDVLKQAVIQDPCDKSIDDLLYQWSEECQDHCIFEGTVSCFQDQI